MMAAEWARYGEFKHVSPCDASFIRQLADKVQE
jgi:hypothetical protein